MTDVADVPPDVPPPAKSSTKRRASMGPAAHVAAHLFTAAMLLAVVYFMTPRLAVHAHRFRAGLPPAALPILECMQQVRRYWYAVPVLLLADVGLLWRLGRRGERGAAWSTTYSLVVLAAAVVVIALIFFGLIFPTVRLVNRWN